MTASATMNFAIAAEILSGTGKNARKDVSEKCASKMIT
jgi:hypothetical protein